MKILIAVLDCIRWIASILLAVAIPFAWILRDGLGPDAKESTGFDAIARTFSSAEVWILAFAFIALSAAVRFLSTRGAGEKKVAKWSWRESASVFSVAFLLCLLGVVAFRDWTDRERQRKAEECLASHAAKWNRTVNLPVAPHGEALTAASLPAKSLFAEILIRDEKGALLPVPRATMEGESLSVENDEIRDEAVADVFKRQTGKERFGRDGFFAFIGADMECSHRCVVSLINGLNSYGIWDILIVARESGEADDVRLVSFKILRPYPGVYPEEDLHLVTEEPFDEEDLSIHYTKPFSLGQRLTFLVGRSVDGSLDGALVYCDKRVSLAELDDILANLAGNPETKGKTVAIKCTEGSPHKALVNVLDILYKHNFKRVYLWTL
ncbi:MAG: hypothetical protein II840_14190 [Kiritimatiellae bacterium]|nr:hypothetical protein [Kiritimatiellia bacterium]